MRQPPELTPLCFAVRCGKAEQTKSFLSIGNQYGEGWFLTGEMIELINLGVPNIVCTQPFACLPNHRKEERSAG